jgi:hypothetical protein
MGRGVVEDNTLARTVDPSPDQAIAPQVLFIIFDPLPAKNCDKLAVLA